MNTANESNQIEPTGPDVSSRPSAERAAPREHVDPGQDARPSGDHGLGNRILVGGEETLKRFGEEARDEVRRPTFGAAVAGAVVVGAAAIWGVAEAAVGALTAYVVFRILKNRRKPASGGAD
jgi:hypothetical protein